MFVDSRNGTFVRKAGRIKLLKKRFATWKVDQRLAVNYVGIVIKRRGGQERDFFVVKNCQVGSTL